jgi:nitrogen fixation protein FixH
MAHAETTRRERRLTGRMVFLMFLAFFGVIVTVNALMLTLALDTMPGTTTASSYQASQRFNRDLAAARERDARGWAVEAHADRDPAGFAAVTISLRDPAGAPVEAVSVKARLEHPARRALDRPLDMARSGTGRYAGSAADVSAGAHDLVVEVSRDGEPLFRSRNRIMLP